MPDVEPTITKIVKSLWALVAFGFGVGVAVTTHQLRLQSLDKYGSEAFQQYVEQRRKEDRAQLILLVRLADRLNVKTEDVENMAKEPGR